MAKRYLIDFKTDKCTIIDKESNIICEFEKHKFNDTQKYDYPENFAFKYSLDQLAKIILSMNYYLEENHKDIL